MSEIHTKINLYQFRHGQTAKELDDTLICGRSNDMPLTDEGVLQSQELGKALLDAGIEPDFVYSSPAERARRTAFHCLQSMEFSPHFQIEDDLQELSQGSWEGKRRGRLIARAQARGIARDPENFRAPGGGESVHDVRLRSRRWLGYIADTYGNLDVPEVNIFAFGHGFHTRVQAGEVRGWTADRIATLKTPNASVSLFPFENGEWSVAYVGRSTESLAGSGVE